MDNYVETKKEKRNKVIDLFFKTEKGKIITNDEINKYLNENINDEYGKKNFLTQMSKIKNELINNGIAIKGIYGVGYYILKNNQIASYAYRNYVLKPTRTFKKAEILLDKSNKKDLNNSDLQKHKIAQKLTSAIEYATNELINSTEYKAITNLKEE